MMIINKLLAKNNITPYRLSKLSGVPHATLSDLINGKTQLEKCSARTVYALSKALGVSMEDLIIQQPVKPDETMYRLAFETFKSNVQHRVKDIGDMDFIITTLKSDQIRAYYNMKWYPESLYLLATIDYLSRINDVPICHNYNDIRATKLKSPIFPSSINAIVTAEKNEQIKADALKHALPEFLRFNIIESKVRHVV